MTRDSQSNQIDRMPSQTLMDHQLSHRLHKLYPLIGWQAVNIDAQPQWQCSQIGSCDCVRGIKPLKGFVLTQQSFHHCSFVGYKKRNAETIRGSKAQSQKTGCVIIAVRTEGMNVGLLCRSTSCLPLKLVSGLPAAGILTCFPWGNPNCWINKNLACFC